MTRLAYILAASHSGSTLLSMLLGSHPRIATVGEMSLCPHAMGELGRYRCSCGVLIQECGFWRTVKEGMAARGFEFDLARAGVDYKAVGSRYARRLLGPLCRGRFLESVRDTALGLSTAWRRQLPEIQRRNAALAAVVSEITRAAIVVDCSKTAVRLKYLLRNPELDVKVIHLIRDGRAVALTYTDPARFADARDPAKRGGGMGGDRQDERLTMAQAAYEWRRSLEEEESILRHLSCSRYIKVRYEDYCSTPDAILGQLCQFLGLGSDSRSHGFRTAAQHVVGNGMRLDTTSEIVLDERWKSVLGTPELKIFNRVAGNMNSRYGYL